MSKRMGNHLRGNAIAYLALFFAVSSGVVWAGTPNSVVSGDIVNGEVKTPDLKNNGVTTGKIVNDGVWSADVRDDTLAGGGLNSEDINAGAIASGEVLDDSLGAADLAPDSVGFSEIDAAAFFSGDISESGGQFQITTGGVDSSDIGDNAVGKAEIQAGSVGASELGDQIVDREDASPTLVPGGAGENGAYTLETSTAGCNAGEELIGGYGKWTPDDQAANDYELWISEVRLNHTSETVVVDGGNDSGVDHSLIAVATCLAL